MHQALKRKGVTLQLLWAEYVAVHGESGYRYSQYCHRYRQWRDRQKRSLRQVHLAGDKLFIDYCGPTVPIVNRHTGEIVEAHVVLREGAAPSEAMVVRLQEHVKKTIAPYKYPRSVRFTDALPKTQTGKIQRFRLRPGGGA